MTPTASVALAGMLALGLASGAGAQAVQHSRHGYHVAACSAAAIGVARCHVHLVTDSRGAPLRYTYQGHGHFAAASPNDVPFFPPIVEPAQLRAAYNITGAGGSTVAIIDAYGYPNAEADLAIFRSVFNLGACGTSNGCLRIVNQGGSASFHLAPNAGWDIEQASDLDTVSSMCPNCKILLVEAHSASLNDLAAAVRTAAAMGAHVISNSYGGGETGTHPFESAYNQPGIAVTASTGDFGYGAQFPATSPHVTAVGGTTLNMAGLSRVSETAWSGTGSGCSAVYPKPAWQTDPLCTTRMEADVSADADPDTPVFLYINVPPYAPGFYTVGGTSISNQIIAGIYGERADAVSYANKIYANPSAFFDITSGTNAPPACGGTYFCVAGPGYDGPTGVGTPNGDTAF